MDKFCTGVRFGKLNQNEETQLKVLDWNLSHELLNTSGWKADVIRIY
jgi:hypothetical protein